MSVVFLNLIRRMLHKAGIETEHVMPASVSL